ncbi:T9SS type A sorting domain-containing protein [Bacteroidota bacterium]
MRRFTLLTVLIAVATIYFGQSQNSRQQILKGDGQIFWEENFDWENPNDIKGWSFPEGWYTEDFTGSDSTGSLGYNWTWKKDSMEGYYALRDGGYILNSTTAENGFLALDLDFYNVAFTPDNYGDMPDVNNSIVLPTMDFSDHSSVIIGFEHMLRHFGYEKMHLMVTNDGGVHWAEFNCAVGSVSTINILNLPNDGIANFVANISEAAAGQSEVQIKILWSGSTLYFWMIDDMYLAEGWDNDLKMLHWDLELDNLGSTVDPNPGFFYMIPKTQINYPITGFEGSVENFGDVDQTGVYFNVDITKHGVSVFSGNSEIIDKGTFEDPDTLYVDGSYLPEEFGHYKVNLSMQGDQEDQNDVNNTESFLFHVTDSVFARTPDVSEVAYSPWKGGYGNPHEGDYIGTEYNPVVDCEASSISVNIPRANVGAEFRFTLMEIIIEDDVELVEELLSTEFVVVDSAILKQGWVTLVLEPDGEGEFLKAGHRYIAAVQFWTNFGEGDDLYRVGNSFWVGATRSYPSSYYKQWGYEENDTDWWSDSNYNHLIRLNINNHENEIDGIYNINENNSLSQNYPNPFSGNTEITYRISTSSDVVLEIFDVTGKKVMSVDEGYRNSGLHKIDLNLSDLNKGVYYYTLTSSKYIATKKMLISN